MRNPGPSSFFFVGRNRVPPEFGWIATISKPRFQASIKLKTWIVVPCHRVLAAGGKPGGFSANGGVVTKLKMLAIEGAVVNHTPSLFD